MPRDLNEHVGSKAGRAVVSKEKGLTEAQVKIGAQDHPFLVKIEAMHSDFITRNHTLYTLESIVNSCNSWTEPYEIPVILYHNDYDGEIVGRVKKAEVAESVRFPGNRCLLLTVAIPGWREQEMISSGLWNTVSIGARANKVRCSICGADLSEGDFCDHVRGEVYDGQVCAWRIEEWEAKEVSFVIVPSDKYAGVISADDGYHYEDSRGFKTLTDAANESEDNSSHIDIKEHEHPERKNKLDIKEAEQKISSLTTEIKALNGDKKTLQESIDSLNSEKVTLQESISELKAKAEEKELALSHEKELREAAENKVEGLEKEVKLSLAESLAALREKAGKAALEKLEERSIDSLRDSIADLKAELKAADTKEAEEKIADSKGAVENPAAITVQESAGNKPEDKKEKATVVDEDFDL